MMNSWYNMTAPKAIWEKAPIKNKVLVVKGKFNSLSGLVFIVFFTILGVVEKEVFIGLLFSLFTFLSLVTFNRKRSTVSPIITIVLCEAAAILLLFVKGETTGITIFLMAFIVVIVCVHRNTAIIILAINIAILSAYMFKSKQLYTSIMYTRFLIEAVVAFASYFCSFSVEQILIKAIEIETVNNILRRLESENLFLLSNQKRISSSIDAIINSCVEFENGKTDSRIKNSQENVIPNLSYIVNNILSRQEKLVKISEELERTKSSALKISFLIHKSTKDMKSFEFERTKTCIDQVGIELKGKIISEKKD